MLPSDLNVGALNRADIESLALLMEESDQRVALGILSAISESCYRAFGFDPLPPQSAVGGLIFSAYIAPDADIDIPVGTQVLGPGGVIFQVTTLGTIPTGELTSETVPVQALTPGTAGNVAADTITRMVTPIVGVDMVTNPAKTLGGSDTETDDARATRFAAFLRTLVRGTKEALEFAALSASTSVADARAIEPFLLDPRPTGVPYAGLVWLFADDGTDSPDLDPGVEDVIYKLVNGYVDGSGIQVPGHKAAGVRVEIYKATRTQVCIRADVTLKGGGVARWADIKDILTATAADFFDRLRIGEKLSYQNLVTYLSGCDADLDEVDLCIWKNGDDVPAYTAALSAEDLVFYDAVSSTTVGARGTLKVGLAPGVSGNVIYPEWRLV